MMDEKLLLCNPSPRRCAGTPRYVSPAKYKRRLFLPVKENRLDQGDDVPAGIVSSTDDSDMDCLQEEKHRVNSQTDGIWPS
jgi:hypothetical protein